MNSKLKGSIDKPGLGSKQASGRLQAMKFMQKKSGFSGGANASGGSGTTQKSIISERKPDQNEAATFKKRKREELDSNNESSAVAEATPFLSAASTAGVTPSITPSKNHVQVIHDFAWSGVVGNSGRMSFKKPVQPDAEEDKPMKDKDIELAEKAEEDAQISALAVAKGRFFSSVNQKRFGGSGDVRSEKPENRRDDRRDNKEKSRKSNPGNMLRGAIDKMQDKDKRFKEKKKRH
eukprot:CAMPEP_0184708606 /NCGR_PEP_ID=MMETSP0313-20130426/37867_1 /TAXON_ID=2792 /ORGANISM="Porphyridium aerugineum, Strain SAG 1380-2" /LENGTH=234 /DNA_ID=CAMNT_0027170203 /DNA_START=80 /DNA_END=784 /DNA_ORIENTATION=-